MKICLVSARFPPQRCGVGDYTYFLACALSRAGHEIDVLTGIGELDNQLYPLSVGVSVHRLIKDWGLGQLGPVMSHLRRLHPDVVLIQYAPHSFDRRGMTLAVNALPVLLRAGKGQRVVTNFHEMYMPFSRSPKRALGAIWQRTMALCLASGSHALSVTSSEWKRRLTRMGVRKPIAVIPVGSSIPRFAISEQDRLSLRQQHLGTSKGLLLAGFGAHHDRDIPAALYGLQRLKRLGPTKLLWIGGGSPNRQHSVRIESAIRDCGLDEKDVKWTGVLPHPEVSRLLSACDLMLLPFIDGVSTRRTSAVTALQHGLPLLTTQGARPEPWFVHGKNVYLTPAGNRKALEEGLVELIKKPELRIRLANGARELYDAHFAWNLIAEQVGSLAK